MPFAQSTVSYRTYLKEAIIEGLRSAFATHPDEYFRGIPVRLSYSRERADYPIIIVRYYERYLRSAGVGHTEWIKISPEGLPDRYQRFKHFFYGGDLDFEIVTLSAKDRDWLGDALVNIIGMSDTEAYMQGFLDRIYKPDGTGEPGSLRHFVNLKNEDFGGYGDQEGEAPWEPEQGDMYIYRTNYRVGVFGEFYSRQIENVDYGVVQAVETYPWMDGIEPRPNPNPEVPTPWIEG